MGTSQPRQQPVGAAGAPRRAGPAETNEMAVKATMSLMRCKDLLNHAVERRTRHINAFTNARRCACLYQSVLITGVSPSVSVLPKYTL